MQHSTAEKEHAILRFLIPFLLVCLFAVCTIIVTVSGLKVYLKIQKDTDLAYQSRTGASYVANRLRRTEGAISLKDNHTLLLTEDENGTAYETYIYFSDNTLWESTVLSGSEPINSEKIVEASDFSIQWIASDLLSFSITGADGRQDTRNVYLGKGDLNR